RSRSLRPWLVGTSVVIFIGFFMAFILDGKTNAWLTMIVLSIGLSAIFYLSLLLPLEETTNHRDTSSWTAMMLCGGYMIGGFGPTFSGWLRDVFGSLGPSFL